MQQDRYKSAFEDIEKMKMIAVKKSGYTIDYILRMKVTHFIKLIDLLQDASNK